MNRRLFLPDKGRLSKPSRAAAHNLTLADELSVELGSVEGKIDVEVHTVERALRSVHPLKVLLEILTR